MKKAGLHGYVYDFSVDIYVDYILYIHKHLIKNTKKMFGFHKNIIGLLSAGTIRRFSRSLVANSQNSIKWISLAIPPCQARPILVDRNSNKTFFLICLLSVLISVVEVPIILIIHMLEYVLQIK